MENMVFDENMDKDPSGEQLLDEGEISAEEEGFMKGYSDDEEVPTCEECGAALRETKVIKEIGGENHRFCCETCAKEYAESLG